MPDDKYEKLLALLPKELKTNRTKAEDELLKKVVVGELLLRQSANPNENDPENADGWDDDRTIRAKFLRWLCIDKDASTLIHARGIKIFGVKLEGSLDFESATLLHPLFLYRCKTEKIILLEATTKTICLNGSHTGPISADNLNLNGKLSIRCNFIARGKISLVGATIDGNLDCNNGSFKNTKGYAINANGITIKGSVLFVNGFSADGEVNLNGASITGDLECTNGTFKNSGKSALQAKHITVEGSVLLNSNFIAEDKKKRFHSGFSADGEVSLNGATITGDLKCTEGTFKNPGGKALNADSIKIKGNIYLNKGFSAKGKVSLIGGNVKGSLVCIKGFFKNKNNDALSADAITVGGNVFFREKFKAEGRVSLIAADIKNYLDCRDGHFFNEQGTALYAERITIGGNMVLTYGFHSKGIVDLLGAKIGGDLDCRGGIFENINDTALNAKRMTVTGTFFWQTKERPIGDINLQHARVAQMEDIMESWPLPGKLHINGFEYSSLSGYSTQPSPKERLEWINLQYPEPFAPNTEPIENKEPIMRYWPFPWLRSRYKNIIKSLPSEKYVPHPNAAYKPQPYEQLAKVLQSMGYEDDARDVYIAKQEALRKNGDIGRWQKYWYWFLFHTIEHGWRPSKVIKRYMLPTIVLGSILFFFADRLCLIVQSKETFFSNPQADYPDFNAIVYSLDTFVPFLNLHQEDYFSIHPHKPWEFIFKLYLWAHIIAGWVFSTLAAVALSGLKRKE